MEGLSAGTGRAELAMAMPIAIFEAVDAVRVAQKAREAAYTVLNEKQFAAEEAHRAYNDAGTALDDAELTLMNTIAKDSAK